MMATELSVAMQSGLPLRSAKMMARSSALVLDCRGEARWPSVASPCSVARTPWWCENAPRVAAFMIYYIRRSRAASIAQWQSVSPVN